MKTLKCEMCGSVDLVKQEGLFVCQCCGTKYSVEEAKKMMVEVEGTVEVQGMVQIDNSSYVEKYLANARRAKEKEDWAEVEKYYNLVEQNDPTNIEAIFYSAFGKAHMSLIDADRFKRENAFSVLANCISIIDDNFDVNHEGENRKIVQQISDDIVAIRGSSFVYNQTTNAYGTYTDSYFTYRIFDKITLVLCESLENIAKKLEMSGVKAEYYYMALRLTKHILNGQKTSYRKTAKGFADRYSAILSQLDPQGMEALLVKEKCEKEAKIERIKNSRKNKVYSISGLSFMMIALVLSILAFVYAKQEYFDERYYYYDDEVTYALSMVSLISVIIPCGFSVLSYIKKNDRLFPLLFGIFGIVSATQAMIAGLYSIISDYLLCIIFTFTSFAFQITAIIFAFITRLERK